MVMAVKDADAWLEDSVKSILSQTFRDFEFLIVDDASKDKTRQILAQFAASDSRIKVFHNEVSIGLPKNLNRLILRARGEYIARMDGDDISKKTRFANQLNFMERHKEIDICFCEADIIMEDGEPLCKKWSPTSIRLAIWMLPFINYFVHPTAFFKRRVIVKLGAYNEKFERAQDWELWQRCQKNGIRMAVVPDALLEYRLRANSSSAQLSSSSKYGADYFKAIVLIRNRRKLQSLHLLPKISVRLFPKYLINLLLPQMVFLVAVILNGMFNRQSAAQTLLRQDAIAKK